MSPPSTNPLLSAAGYSLFDVYGPVMIGVLLSVFGCGIVLHQTLSFLARYPDESLATKALLYFILALNVAQSVSDSSRLLKLCVYHAGDIIYFLDIRARPEDVLSPSLSIGISTIVQIFLARRCVLFAQVTASPDRRRSIAHALQIALMVGVLGLGIGLSGGTGLGTAIYLEELPNYVWADRNVQPHGTFPTLATIWLSSSSGTDLLIACIIVYELRNAVRGGNKMVNAVIRIAVRSGAIVTALQVTTLIMYLHAVSAWANWGPIFISKVYTMTLLAAIAEPRAVTLAATGSRRHPPAPGVELPLSVPRLVDSWRSQNDTFGAPREPTETMSGDTPELSKGQSDSTYPARHASLVPSADGLSGRLMITPEGDGEGEGEGSDDSHRIREGKRISMGESIEAARRESGLEGEKPLGVLDFV